MEDRKDDHEDDGSEDVTGLDGNGADGVEARPAPAVSSLPLIRRSDEVEMELLLG